MRNSLRRAAALAALLAAAPAAAAGADEAPRLWRLYGDYEYFLPSNSGEGLNAQLQTQSDGLVAAGYDSSSHSVTPTGGAGTRVGALRRLDARTEMGVSLSYALGPTMNSNLTAQSPPVSLGGLGNGGQTVNRSAFYARALVETRIDLLDRGPWDLALGSGFGLGVGHVDQSCASSGSLTCAIASASKTWEGFAWEFGPIFAYRLKKVEVDFGVRYAGFPRFKGNGQIPEIRWDTFGILFGASF